MSKHFWLFGAVLAALGGTILLFSWLFGAASFPRVPLQPVSTGWEVPPSGGIGEFLSRFALVPWSSPPVTPVAVIIENHEDARPYQRGMDRALFLAEFLVEGYISRFIAFFDRSDLPEQIGPVRSLRPYFLSVIQPWSSALLFAGGSPEALRDLERSAVPWVNLLGVDDTTLRDRTVPPPHNMFLRPAQVAALLDGRRRLRPVRWPPFPLGGPERGSGASLIRLQFFSPLHNVEYRYDALEDAYVRTSGEVTHTARPRNVLVLAMPIMGEGEHGRLDIRPRGGGPALLFSSGIVREGRWERGEGDREPFRFLSERGELLRFAPGFTWMTVLPDLSRVRWEGGGGTSAP